MFSDYQLEHLSESLSCLRQAVVHLQSVIETVQLERAIRDPLIEANEEIAQAEEQLLRVQQIHSYNEALSSMSI